MQRANVWGVAMLSGALALSGCARGTEAATKVAPAKVERIAGTDLSRVLLTAKAAERIGIETALVRALSSAGGAPNRSVAYSAVIYDPDGVTSVYTNPEPLVFIKQPITVEHITGDVVVISAGPPVGTAVVTVGATELFGIEFGIGEFE